MNKSWQLQEAKKKLSELVERALKEGAQVITRRGETVVVVIPYQEYEQMTRPFLVLDVGTSRPRQPQIRDVPPAGGSGRCGSAIGAAFETKRDPQALKHARWRAGRRRRPHPWRPWSMRRDSFPSPKPGEGSQAPLILQS